MIIRLYTPNFATPGDYSRLITVDEESIITKVVENAVSHDSGLVVLTYEESRAFVGLDLVVGSLFPSDVLMTILLRREKL
jgi:hypothetical protein